MNIVLILGTFGMLILTVGIILFVIFHQRKVIRYNVQLKKLEEEKQQILLNASIRFQEEERQRIAADLPDDDRPEWPHDEACTEGRERQQQRRQRVVRRKEKLADDDRGKAVDREVVRDKRVADDGSQDDAGGS